MASTTNAPLYRYPTNRVFLTSCCARHATRRASTGVVQEHEQWNIGLLHQPISELLKEKPSLNVRWLPDPAPDAFPRRSVRVSDGRWSAERAL